MAKGLKRMVADATDPYAREVAALKAFNRMVPGLRSFARNLTNTRVNVQAGPNNMTDGKTIMLRPPMALAENPRHSRNSCGTRDSLNNLVCPACAVREDITSGLQHEIAHIVHGSFQKFDRWEIESSIGKTIQEYFDPAQVREMHLYMSSNNHVNGLFGLIPAIDKHLAMAWAIIEDIRINRASFIDRPGLEDMHRRRYQEVLDNGVKVGDHYIEHWNTRPLDHQMLAAFLFAEHGVIFRSNLADDTLVINTDRKIQVIRRAVPKMKNTMDAVKVAARLVSRLRELGYLQLESQDDDIKDDEPESGESDEQGEESDEQEEGSEGSGEGSGGDGESEGEDAESDGSDSGDSSGGSDDADESGDGGSDSGSGSTGMDSGDDSTSEPEGGSYEDDQESGEGSGSGGGGSAGGSGHGSGGGGDRRDSTPPEASASDSDNAEGGREDSGDTEDDDSGDGDEGGGDDEESTQDSDGGAREGDGDSGEDDSAGGGQSDGLPVDADEEAPGRDRNPGGEHQQPQEGPEAGPEQQQPGEPDGDDGAADATGGDDERDARPAREGATGPEEQAQEGDERDGSASHEGDGGDGQPTPGGAEEAPVPELTPKKGGSLEGMRKIIEALLGHAEHDTGHHDQVVPMQPGETAPEKQDVTTPQGDEPQVEENDDILSPQESDADGMEDDMAKVVQAMWFLDRVPRNIAGIKVHGRGDGPAFDSMYSPDYLEKVPESVLGKAVSRARIAFGVNHRAEHHRNQKAGRIAPAVLGKRAPLGDKRLFAKKVMPDKRSYAVVIGYDVSMSTHGTNARLINESVQALAEVCSRIGIDFSIYCHSTEGDGWSSENMEVSITTVKGWKDRWDTKTKKLMASIGPVSGNLDGHTMQFYRKQLDVVQATDKILIYFTDGAMPASNYDEELEVLQEEIEVCKKRRYTLLGVGIRTNSPEEHGLETVEVDGARDVGKVVDLLQKKIAHL